MLHHESIIIIIIITHQPFFVVAVDLWDSAARCLCFVGLTLTEL